MRLELGSGRHPTPGCISSDAYPHPNLDMVADAWDIDLPDGSLDEVLALGVMEHLTYEQFHATVENVRRMLRPGGVFLFDVPDLVAWCRYLVHPETSPFDRRHVLSTLYGWQRWPGDEHKSGWTADMLLEALYGFRVTFDVEAFLARGYQRRRMTRPGDAHLYVEAVRA